MNLKWTMGICLILTSALTFANPTIEKPFASVPGRIYLEPAFKKFAASFFQNLFDYGRAHQSDRVRQDPQAFFNAIRQSDGEEATVAAIYKEFGLDFDLAMSYKNALDNTLLHLFRNYRFFLELSEEEAWQVITNELTYGYQELHDREWLELQQTLVEGAESFLKAGYSAKLRPAGTPRLLVSSLAPTLPFRLSVREVVDCAYGAIGLGGASVLSVGALLEIAKKEGMQAVVGTVSRWLAKRAGWIGLGIALWEFGRCLATEAQD